MLALITRHFHGQPATAPQHPASQASSQSTPSTPSTPAPEPLVGYVPLRDRSVTRPDPLEIFLAGMAAVVALPKMEKLVGDIPAHTLLLATSLVIFTVRKAADVLDARGQASEARYLAQAGLTRRQQVLRVLELANAQGLTGQGLERCISRLKQLHHHHPEAGGPAQLALDIAALGRRALHMPSAWDISVKSRFSDHLALLCGSIRELQCSHQFDPEGCLAALDALRTHVMDRPGTYSCRVKANAVRFLDREIAAVQRQAAESKVD